MVNQSSELDPRAADVAAGSSVPAVEWVMTKLREMILRGGIAPGVHLRQEDLAAKLGVSRAPIREALKALSTEGLLVHNPNRGYFLTSLGAKELRQIYAMRRLLETHLLSNLEWPTKSELTALTAMNKRMKDSAGQTGRHAFIAANREFHFRIFDLAHADLIVREVQRLWDLSDAYRSLYLVAEESRTRVVREHDELIKALGKHDTKRCIVLMDEHRQSAEERVAALLGEVDHLSFSG